MARPLTIAKSAWIYARLFRLPNLLIVVLTQYLLVFLVLFPAYGRHDISPALTAPEFFLLSLTTVVIVAAGYLINDLFDEPIDRINKPDRQVIGARVPTSVARRWYSILFFGGLLIALYLAATTHNLPLLVLYPLAFGLLWLYSRHFKKQLLIGNLVVAFFCAFVAGIVWVAERPAIELLRLRASEEAWRLSWILGSYMVFAFLSTWYRELIKDLEDEEGDRRGHCRTLPILYGRKAAKVVAAFLAVALLLLLLLLYDKVWTPGPSLRPILLSVIAAPILLSLIWLYRARKPGHFHRLSSLVKFVMLTGLLLLFFL